MLDEQRVNDLRIADGVEKVMEMVTHLLHRPKNTGASIQGHRLEERVALEGFNEVRGTLSDF